MCLKQTQFLFLENALNIIYNVTNNIVVAVTAHKSMSVFSV